MSASIPIDEISMDRFSLCSRKVAQNVFYNTIVMSNLNEKNRMCKSDSLFIVGKSGVKSYVKVDIGE